MCIASRTLVLELTNPDALLITRLLFRASRSSSAESPRMTPWPSTTVSTQLSAASSTASCTGSSTQFVEKLSTRYATWSTTRFSWQGGAQSRGAFACFFCRPHLNLTCFFLVANSPPSTHVSPRLVQQGVDAGSTPISIRPLTEHLRSQQPHSLVSKLTLVSTRLSVLSVASSTASCTGSFGLVRRKVVDPIRDLSNNSI